MLERNFCSFETLRRNNMRIQHTFCEFISSRRNKAYRRISKLNQVQSWIPHREIIPKVAFEDLGKAERERLVYRRRYFL